MGDLCRRRLTGLAGMRPLFGDHRPPHKGEVTGQRGVSLFPPMPTTSADRSGRNSGLPSTRTYRQRQRPRRSNVYYSRTLSIGSNGFFPGDAPSSSYCDRYADACLLAPTWDPTWITEGFSSRRDSRVESVRSILGRLYPSRRTRRSRQAAAA